MLPTLAFDIETIPDIAGLRRLHDLPDALPDADVAEMAFQKRRASHGHDFLPLHLHRVVAIACAMREGEHFRVWSLGEPDEDEASLLRRFFDGIERYTPQLVSWNGGGFDLPVMHYRALVHGLSAPRYWDQGEDDRDFKWNNYISRYHHRHLDLMDLLALYQSRANAPLDAMAKLCGFPGKLGMDGSAVYEAYLNGQLEDIRRYCETDVMNTYLLYCRYQLMRGGLRAEEYRQEMRTVRESLQALVDTEPHWHDYLAAWPEPPSPDHV